MQISRRQAREWIVQMLVAADLNPPEDVRAFIDEYWEQLSTIEEESCGTEGHRVHGKNVAFVETCVQGVLADLAAIDAALAPLLDHWDVFRLGTVERAVLRLGAWEIMNTDVPKAVVINEAVDIANWFSSARSRSLINGVLDKFNPTKG